MHFQAPSTFSLCLPFQDGYSCHFCIYCRTPWKLISISSLRLLPPTPVHSCLTLHFQNSSTDGCADLIFTFPFALFNLLVKLHVWANCDSICCLHWFAISGLGICHCLQRFTDEPQFTNDSYINSRELTCCVDFTLGRHIKVFHLDKVQKTVHSVSK